MRFNLEVHPLQSIIHSLSSIVVSLLILCGVVKHFALDFRVSCESLDSVDTCLNFTCSPKRLCCVTA